MKNADEAGSEVFSFIHFEKHAKDHIADRVKEAMEKGTVIEKVNTKFFRDSEYTMAMNTRDKLAGHMKRTSLVVTIAAGRAETALATESNKLQVTTMRASIHDTAIGRVTAMKHLVDIFDNRSTWMKFINQMFIIIIKNGL